MLYRLSRFTSAAAAALICSGTAVAHHSFIGQFDPEQQVTLVGTVTELKWTNPHAFFYIDVENDSGETANWAIELGSPNTLIRYRWTRDTLKPGDVVTVEGYLARDGSKLANAKTVVFPDGTVTNAGSSSNLAETR